MRQRRLLQRPGDLVPRRARRRNIHGRGGIAQSKVNDVQRTSSRPTVDHQTGCSVPIEELLAAVPHVPVSSEVRSRALRDCFTDPVERARHLLRSAERLGAL